ncbi:MAG: indolepyruvate oxidoreductase subunit beta [Firmicutes bacterium]|nr:indolepyruvate oxidoreductase subunit beta [Bacillota bacterium]
MENNLNILIAGVGGQGTLLASRILGSLASEMGLDCKVSEIHGMSQRGGSVTTHVRISKEVLSPVITEGEADYLLAFEKLEAFRYRHYLKKSGLLICNDQELMPVPVIIGVAKYPENIFEKLKAEGFNVKIISALALAKEAGSIKTVNVVILGAVMKIMGVDYKTAVRVAEAVVPKKLWEVNKKALELGYQCTIKSV